jgi:tetratricopeptide (TPR) repeat protein
MTDTDLSAGITDKDVKASLQRAVAHLQRNEMAQAEGILNQIIARRPAEADALQLLGTIRRAQQRDDLAEGLFRQSLEIKPGQPHVHHNLGSLFRSARRLDEAVAEQREAVRLKPNYAEAHLSLGLCLADAGAFADAEKSIRESLRIQPNYVQAKQGLAAMLNDTGRPKQAEALLRQTLALGVRDQRQAAALEHNLGVALTLQDRYEEALGVFDTAQKKAPDMALVDYNRGNALQGAGRLDDALRSYQRAIARNPLDLIAHSDLNQLLYRMADKENFLRSYNDVLALYPDRGELHLGKANFLFRLDDFAAAREEFEKASALLRNHVMPHDGLGLVYARLGEFDRAIVEHETAVRMEPDNAPAWRNFAETLARGGDAKKALEAVERSLSIDPDNQLAIALYGTALDMLGDPEGEELNDFENLVQVFEIPPPEGYPDMAAFNRDLNGYLNEFHRDRRESIDQSLRSGTQTLQNLFGRGHELIERLRERIDAAVVLYMARMKDDEKHPLLRRRKKDFGYAASWSSRLRDCGYHTNHVHSKGWISSAYYIDLPDVIADSQDHQGWIKFGEPSFDAGLKEPVRRIIQPKAGSLVLFPSYMWHGTVPFHSTHDRTTIAFDVVPK